MRARLFPFLVLGTGVAVVSFASILIRLAQAEGASSLTISAVRLSLASLLLAPIVWARNRSEILGLGYRELGLCLLSGVFLALHFWTWITSLEYTTVASSAALVTTNPLWVALVSVLWLRERPGQLAILGIALSIVGSVLIFAGDASAPSANASEPLLGNSLALAGAVFASGYLLVGRALRSRISLLAYVWLAYSAAAILLLLGVVIADNATQFPTPAAWVFMVLLALGPQLIGHTSFNWALRRMSATFVAVAILGEPVGSAILAYLLLGESFGGTQFAGFIILLSGIFVAAQGEKLRESKDRKI
ncbi:MAG: DMT family transporter [Burkholderiales bacterium]